MGDIMIKNRRAKLHILRLDESLVKRTKRKYFIVEIKKAKKNTWYNNLVGHQVRVYSEYALPERQGFIIDEEHDETYIKYYFIPFGKEKDFLDITKEYPETNGYLASSDCKIIKKIWE